MIINTNGSSLITQNYLRQASKSMESTMERLSSGKRINGAGDDAAGLAIVSKMEAATRGMAAAKRNSMDGISLIQTAESALGSINAVLQRMRELAVQADNGTYSTEDLANLQAEFAALIEEIDHVADTTEFNGVSLLNVNGGGTVAIHVSNLEDDTIDVKTYDATSATLLGATAPNISTDAQGAITALDTAIDTVSTNRAELGALENRLNFTIDNLNSAEINLTSSKSRIEDADMAKEMSSLTRDRIISQSAISMLSQANQNPQMILSLLQG